MRKKCLVSYADIVSLENLCTAWDRFLVGKRNKQDVQEFRLHLMDNLIELHQELKKKAYQHGVYQHFVVIDPKRRDIHKASVRDRLVHHAVHQQLYPFFDSIFISDVYSSRKWKGTHKAMDRFGDHARIVSKNLTRTCWVLKCDIQKFFASVDHDILIILLQDRIVDEDVMWLLENIIRSFDEGLPLGNLTSQLLVNVYMHEFDQFVKHKLRIKHYVRYADDFVFLYEDREILENILPEIEDFLWERLRLKIHTKKISIQTFASGVDFLGWVHFADHRALRTVTKRRMTQRLNEKNRDSYVGMLKHGNAEKIRNRLFE